MWNCFKFDAEKINTFGISGGGGGGKSSSGSISGGSEGGGTGGGTGIVGIDGMVIGGAKSGLKVRLLLFRAFSKFMRSFVVGWPALKLGLKGKSNNPPAIPIGMDLKLWIICSVVCPESDEKDDAKFGRVLAAARNYLPWLILIKSKIVKNKILYESLSPFTHSTNPLDVFKYLK